MSNAVKVYKHFQTPKSPGIYHRMICLTGERKGVAYFLMDGKRVVLGRSEESDIRIFDLKSSREHAEIVQVGDDWIVTDLSSQNGIIVNDLRIKQHVLTEGDKVIIGKTVFKFSRIKVAAKAKVDESFLSEQEITDQEEDKKKDKKLSLILGGVIVLAVILLGFDTPEEAPPELEKIEATAPEGLEDSFESAIQNRIKANQKTKDKLGRYFHRGLREYREGNYFRAYVEFENARQWNPKDPTANFYLRKTKEKQNEIIASYFSKGSRDKDALNYKAATTAYCTIVRLLIHQAPKDERILQARESLRLIEEKTGAEKNSIVCVKK